MKFSTAILKGYEKVNGRQTFGRYCSGTSTAPYAVCVYGAANLATTGDAENENDAFDGGEFYAAWGEFPDALNDEGMPWEHIYGMAKAAGL